MFPCEKCKNEYDFDGARCGLCNRETRTCGDCNREMLARVDEFTKLSLGGVIGLMCLQCYRAWLRSLIMGRGACPGSDSPFGP